MDIFERPLVGYCAVMGKPIIQNLKRIGLHLELAQAGLEKSRLKLNLCQPVAFIDLSRFKPA